MTIKVAHVTTIAASLDLLLKRQLVAISNAGYDVVGISASGPSVAKLEAAGIPHLAAPFVRKSTLDPFADLQVFAHLVRMFRRERFTIVHTHTAKPDLYAAMAARAAGVPIVITTLHGFYFHDRMPALRRRMFANLARVGMTCADFVLSQNAEDIDTAVREKLCPPRKLALLGNGIDLTRFDRARLVPAELVTLRSSLGLPADALVVGFAGRLVEEKGVRELFAAFRKVRANYPRAYLLLVGPFDREKQDAIDESTAAQFGISDRTVFAGYRDDVAELMALMDVFVLPSHREGFPRTVMEASAMGVPVIATDIRGCRAAVEPERSGLLVPPQDPEALASALGEMLGSTRLRERMGQAGRALAVERFDERRVFAIVLDTYRRLLAEKYDSAGA